MFLCVSKLLLPLPSIALLRLSSPSSLNPSPSLAQVLLKAIEFLYRHWDLLPEAQAEKLRLVILRSCYWRLLLHWSPAVRHFWCHLLAFRLHQRCCWSLSPSRRCSTPDAHSHLYTSSSSTSSPSPRYTLRGHHALTLHYSRLLSTHRSQPPTLSPSLLPRAHHRQP